MSLLCRLLTALLLFAAPPVRAQEVRVLINDAPPYRMIESVNGARHYTGIYIDILRLVASDLGLTLAFVEMPFARAFRAMQAGDGDIMLGPTRSPDREAYLHYLEPPLPRETKVFVQQRLAEPVRRYEDLSGKTIGVLRGAAYFDRFDADPTLVRQPFDDYAAALRLVAIGRIDMAAMPELQALWMQRQTGHDLVLSPYRVPGRDSHIVVETRSPLMQKVPQVEAGLRHLQQDGRIADILHRYE